MKSSPLWIDNSIQYILLNILLNFTISSTLASPSHVLHGICPSKILVAVFYIVEFHFCLLNISYATVNLNVPNGISCGMWVAITLARLCILYQLFWEPVTYLLLILTSNMSNVGRVIELHYHKIYYLHICGVNLLTMSPALVFWRVILRHYVIYCREEHFESAR